MTLRIGDILVSSGTLTEQQRDQVLEEQVLQGRPFGQLAEHLFGIDPRAVEHAWASQYAEALGTTDPLREAIDPIALEAISPRQAWQFRLLPMRREMTASGAELIVCTTERGLPRALRFVSTHLDEPTSLVVAEPGALGKALERHYPIAGFTAEHFAAEFRGLLERNRVGGEFAA